LITAPMLVNLAANNLNLLMKKRYLFSLKTWLCVSLSTTFVFSSALSLQAQTAPAKLWDKTFGGGSFESLDAVQQTSDGGYLLGGDSSSGISGNKSQASKGLSDYWVVKLDANGNKLWEKAFGGSDRENFQSLQQTSDGGYILGGSSSSGISGDKTEVNKGTGITTDYWVVKMDANGNKIWDKTFGGSSNDNLWTLLQTSDGGFILGGWSESGIGGDKSQASKGGNDYWVVKLDANGNKIWDKTFGGSSDDYLSSLQQTADGGYILGGKSDSGISSDKSQPNNGPIYTFDYWVVKTDASGNKLWEKTFGGNDNDNLGSILQTSGGEYILSGGSASLISGDKSQKGQGGWDHWVLKLNGSGNKLWDKNFGTNPITNTNTSYSLGYLQQTPDGGFISGGTTGSGLSSNTDYLIVKVDSSGNKIWDKILSGDSWDFLHCLKKTSDGGYILGGMSKSNINGDKTQASQGDYDYWVVKIGGSVTGLNESTTVFPVSIYPNPSTGLFNISLPQGKGYEITVTDLTGKVVKQLTVRDKDARLNMSGSAKGIYLLQLKAGELTTTRKIVVE
jgi:hypothetical protein